MACRKEGLGIEPYLIEDYGLFWVLSQNPKTSGRLPDPEGHTRGTETSTLVQKLIYVSAGP